MKWTLKWSKVIVKAGGSGQRRNSNEDVKSWLGFGCYNLRAGVCVCYGEFLHQVTKSIVDSWVVVVCQQLSRVSKRGHFQSYGTARDYTYTGILSFCSTTEQWSLPKWKPDKFHLLKEAFQISVTPLTIHYCCLEVSSIFLLWSGEGGKYSSDFFFLAPSKGRP